MNARKVLTAIYLLGAAIFAFGLIAIALALFGTRLVGEHVELAWPAIAGFVLMMGSKYAAAVMLRKQTHG